MAKNEPEKPDLISRQELLQVISDHTAALGGSAPLQTAVLAWVKALVQAMPAKAVLVDLVRCKNCERWKGEEGQSCAPCEKWSIAELPGLLQAVTHMTGPDDFCSDARRRTTGGIDIRG